MKGKHNGTGQQNASEWQSRALDKRLALMLLAVDFLILS